MKEGTEQFCGKLEEVLDATSERETILLMGNWNASTGEMKNPIITGRNQCSKYNYMENGLIILQKRILYCFEHVSNTIKRDAIAGYDQKNDIRVEHMTEQET